MFDPNRDDGWRPLSRHPGAGNAEQVRLELLLDRKVWAWKQAHDLWITLSVAIGMGCSLTPYDPLPVSFQKALVDATMATEAWRIALE